MAKFAMYLGCTVAVRGVNYEVSARKVGEAFGMEFEDFDDFGCCGYPVMGIDAFRTGTGVHAAAIIKAREKGDAWLADRVYSGVPAGSFGARQIIEISPMSGLSNVKFWLSEHGYDPTNDVLAHRLFDAAKEGDRTLTEKECLSIVAEVLGKQ